MYGPIFFEEPSLLGKLTVVGNTVLMNWLLLRQAAKGGDYIFQQDSTPSHWNLAVRTFLNANLKNRWIGLSGQHDEVLCK